MTGDKFQDDQGKWHREGDKPLNELIEMANNFRDASEGAGDIHFVFTCENCGERCKFDEPNTYFEFGECASCGHMTKFTKGGFSVHFTIGGNP